MPYDVFVIGENMSMGSKRLVDPRAFRRFEKKLKMKFSPPLHSSEVGEASKEGRGRERAGDIVLVPRPTWASITPPPPTSLRISRLCPSVRDGVLSKLFLLNSRGSQNGNLKKRILFPKERLSSADQAGFFKQSTNISNSIIAETKYKQERRRNGSSLVDRKSLQRSSS